MYDVSNYETLLKNDDMTQTKNYYSSVVEFTMLLGIIYMLNAVLINKIHITSTGLSAVMAM